MQINLQDLIFTGLKVLGAYWLVSGIAYVVINLIYSLEAIFLHWTYSMDQYHAILNVTVDAFKIVNGIMYIAGGIILTRYTEKCIQFVFPENGEEELDAQ